MERSAAVNTRAISQESAPERGAALLLAIFALAAIGFVSLKLVLRATAYSQLSRIYRDGLMHHAALRESIQPLVSQQRRCEIQHLTGRGIAGVDAQGAQWYVCTNGQPTFLSNHDIILPRISPDYGAIFGSSSTPCPFSRSTITLRTFDAPTAPFNCLLPSTIQGDTIILDNITADSTIISPSTPARAITIATPGSLIASASLSVAGDTLIIAGGNVRIATLRSLGSPFAAPTASVTLLSAHGDIVIERVEGALSLLTLGRRTVSVPETSTPIAPPLPATRALTVAGFGPQ